MEQNKNTHHNILVCITQQKNCERLIRRGATEQKNLGAQELHVIHVTGTNRHFLQNEKEGEALEYLFDVSKGLGANLIVLKSDEIEQTIADYAVHHHVKHIILGASHEKDNEHRFYNTLKSLIPMVSLIVV